MFDLNNKTALVTGGSRGIGRATVLALANAGVHVIVHYGRAADEANALVNEIRAKGGKADAVGADLAEPDSPAKQVKAIIGDKLDIVVANAGISGAATIAEQTVADFDSFWAVNVRGPYFLVQQLLPLLHDGSSVILISSLAAGSAVGNLSVYASTKGADDTLVKYFAAALGGEPPTHPPRWLLMRVLAYRLQSDAFGGLDKSIQRILRSGKEDGVGAPFDRRAPQTRQGLGLKAGALLVREWKGRLERVMILEAGFAWNGQTFGSLSQIAKAMTGTDWNGHRHLYARLDRAGA
jgi:3-oxoacyl-[acyl-carrier protein] reductase